jgi:4'-phosphopantetheinyl transferase
VTPDEIHLWSLSPDTVADGQWPALEAVLDDDEKARAARLRFESDRHAFIAAHALLRHMLTYFGDRAPEVWRFAVGEHGKPRIADPPPGQPLHFNLTHARGMVAAAVTRAGAIGVDVEPLDGLRVDTGIADHCFAAQEVAALRALPDEAAMAEHFIRLWTLKEAFVKATGKGLSQPLGDFAFVCLDPVRVVFHDHALGNPEQWVFWQHRVGRHVLAAGIQWPGHRPPVIVHRTVRLPFPAPGLAPGPVSEPELEPAPEPAHAPHRRC